MALSDDIESFDRAVTSLMLHTGYVESPKKSPNIDVLYEKLAKEVSNDIVNIEKLIDDLMRRIK